MFEIFQTYFTPFSSVSIVDFEQVNVSWVVRDLVLIRKFEPKSLPLINIR